jgi:hypothetical protein
LAQNGSRITDELLQHFSLKSSLLSSNFFDVGYLEVKVFCAKGLYAADLVNLSFCDKGLYAADLVNLSFCNKGLYTADLVYLSFWDKADVVNLVFVIRHSTQLIW